MLCFSGIGNNMTSLLFISMCLDDIQLVNKYKDNPELFLKDLKSSNLAEKLEILELSTNEDEGYITD